MTKKIRPAKETDVTAYLRRLFLKTEQELIREIKRKRSAGYVDYAEVAALERVQKILQDMVDESWEYIPEMIETIFYHSDKEQRVMPMPGRSQRPRRTLYSSCPIICWARSWKWRGTARKSVEAVFTIRQTGKWIRSGGLPWNRSCARRRRAVHGSEAAGTW